MTTCRAAAFNGDGTYDIRTFPKPTPPPGGAVLKVEAVGMCSSDVSQLAGHKHVPGEVAPVVAGHEQKMVRGDSLVVGEILAGGQITHTAA